jgi:hypothetical protein
MLLYHIHIGGLWKVALQLVSATELQFSYNMFIVKDNFVLSLNGILKIYSSVWKMLEIGTGW